MAMSGDYKATLHKIAAQASTTELASLVVQLADDLEIRFNMLNNQHAIIIGRVENTLIAIVNDVHKELHELKTLDTDRYIKLERQFSHNEDRVADKLHTLSNVVNSLQLKIDDLVMLMMDDRPDAQ